MLESLHELFEQDRRIASQSDGARCGICYLHYPVTDLKYRDEGFYVCGDCEQALGKQKMPLIRKQQR